MYWYMCRLCVHNYVLMGTFECTCVDISARMSVSVCVCVRARACAHAHPVTCAGIACLMSTSKSPWCSTGDRSLGSFLLEF